MVDDGLATGVTARAALRAVRARADPGARTVLAVPVAAANSLAAIKAEADEVVTVVTTRRLRSVGEWYVDFGQLTDADVLTLLSSSGGYSGHGIGAPAPDHPWPPQLSMSARLRPDRKNRDRIRLRPSAIAGGC